MSDAYIKIKNSLEKTRRDYLFPSSLLDELEDNERREIEEIIIKLCLLGDKSCFQYIDHLKVFNPEEIFNEESMKNITSTKKAFIYKRLYYITKNNLYLARLYELSKIDINAFSILTLIYQDKDIDHMDIYPYLERMSTKNDDYKQLFEIRCKKDTENDIKQL